MARREMTREKLAALFMAKAAEAPPAADLILARHLQCKESCDLSSAIAESAQRYAGTDRTLLQVPLELLSPLA